MVVSVVPLSLWHVLLLGVMLVAKRASALGCRRLAVAAVLEFVDVHEKDPSV
ncbi:hypothetical protein DPMN_159388 [Dreissena polymorpha]|uniref:Uncharacterized protein n=1 Tax=Dreissena polymorpha TaxID=45954 RepID=A0A9D4EJP9_DREPO|nr:hypothetical protein DPMN_159388 [Dreissena polymorpha]